MIGGVSLIKGIRSCQLVLMLCTPLGVFVTHNLRNSVFSTFPFSEMQLFSSSYILEWLVLVYSTTFNM